MRLILFSLLSAVIVQTPTVKLVPWQRLHDVCGMEGEYDACTRFVAYSLDATCVSGKIEASVTFRPMIFLWNIEQLSHEQAHIEDIRRFADAYVTDIEQKTFETDSQCRAEVQLAMDGFGATMRGFALRSNRERHPLLRIGLR